MLSILGLAMRSSSVSHHSETYCILTVLIFVLSDITILWPILMRLYYVQRVAAIIKSFYSDTSEQLALLKYRKSLIGVLFVISVVTVYSIVYILVISGVSQIRQCYCICRFNSLTQFVFFEIIQGFAYVLEVIVYVYFLIGLCKLQTQLKYKIKEELLLLSLGWFLNRLTLIIQINTPFCPF